MDRWLPGPGAGEKVNPGGTQERSGGEVSVPCRDRGGGGYTALHICQNSQTCTLKTGQFNCMLLHCTDPAAQPGAHDFPPSTRATEVPPETPLSAPFRSAAWTFIWL